MATTPVDDAIDAALMGSSDWLNEFFSTFDGDVASALLDDVEAFEQPLVGDHEAEVGQVPRGESESGLESKKRKAVDEVENEVENASVGNGVRTSTLSDGARKTKSTREKKRRDALNSRFEELQAVLEPGAATKADKATVVAAATVFIKRLRAEHARLAEGIMRLQEDNIQKAKLTKALAIEREALRKEKQILLHEKLRIEAQLQGFLANMPFASPADGVRSLASTKGAEVQMPSWTLATTFMIPTTTEGEEDVTLRAPVA